MKNFVKNQVNLYSVTENDHEQRLDNLLIKILKGVPKSYIYRIIRNGEVRVNKKRAEFSLKVCNGDIVRIPPVSISDSATKLVTIPKKIFPILFEDEHYLIINKPSGIACHGGSGISFGIIEQLRSTYSELKFLELAHRLDKETSGILILAKKRSALVAMQELIKKGQLQKHYLALSLGVWDQLQLTIKEPLFKYLTPEGERRVRVDPIQGVPSHTNFRVIQKFNNFTLVKAILKTGRTHQIRVHLNHIKHPIAGDDKYGDFPLNKELHNQSLKRMFLHAYQIRFIHPVTEKLITLEANLPSDLLQFLYRIDPEYKFSLPK